MTTDSAKTHSHIMPTYAPQPISFVKGQGSWLYSKDNTAYLDALTGIAVCGLGHCHPKVSKQFVSSSNYAYQQFISHRLARTGCDVLCAAANMDSVLPIAAEAMKWPKWHIIRTSKGLQQPKVIVMEKSFHGRTLYRVATANRKLEKGFYT